MQVNLISHTPDAARLLVFTKATRLSMTSARMDHVRAMSEEELHKELLYMADTIPSSWEFVDYVFTVEGVSRAYTHQQVRTRAGSYAQQSMRVTDMAEFDYVFSERIAHDPMATGIVTEVLSTIKHAYRRLTSLGIPAEDARGILPTNIATNIVCKFNLRTMSELARSRTGGRTQAEYRDVVNKMIDAVLVVHPWAEAFLFSQRRDYFDELEKAIHAEWPNDLLKKGVFLKIIDKMRKERT